MIKHISAVNGCEKLIEVYFEVDNMDNKKYNLMIAVLIILSGITVGAEWFIDVAGSGGWWIAILCTIIAAGVYSLLFNSDAMEKFVKSNTLLNIIIAWAVVLAGVFYAASLTASVADNITTAFLNRTPVPYMLVLLVLPGAVGCWFGTKSLARYGLPVAAGGVAVIVLLFVMCIGEYDTDNLYPLWGRGTVGFIKGTLGIRMFAPVLFYYVILIGEKCNNIKLNVTKILLLSGGAVGIVCLGINMLLPYPGAEVTSMPLYTMGSSVNGNYLIERSESVVLVIWLFCAYISVGAVTSVISDFCTSVFNLDNRNALTGALCGSVLAVGLMVCALDIAEKAFALSCTILCVLSLVLPVVVNIRYRFGR